MYDLSVVIPAYNEEKKIGNDIENIYHFFNENSINGELLVIDDGSKDSTFSTASSYKKKYPSLKVITYERNRGKGYATKTGILEATSEYMLLIDAGSSVPLNYIHTGLNLLKSGNDVAMGSRSTADKGIVTLKQPFYRRFGSKGFKFIIQAINLIPKGIEDTQCGFKLFKKKAAHDIFKKMFTEKNIWDIEMIRRALKGKYKISVFPVEWKNDPDTRFNPFIGSFETILQLFNIILRT
jgi:dolichyl-phosphate beta-glucosyltransferase